MNSKTLAALQESIKHWQRALNDSGESLGPHSCALCKIYFPWQRPGTGCGSCPVKEKTGKDLCDDSPYLAASEAQDLVFEKTDPDDRLENARKQAIQAELDFLISLLPETKP